jgi:hypothetical protein
LFVKDRFRRSFEHRQIANIWQYNLWPAEVIIPFYADTRDGRTVRKITLFLLKITPPPSSPTHGYLPSFSVFLLFEAVRGCACGSKQGMIGGGGGGADPIDRSIAWYLFRYAVGSAVELGLKISRGELRNGFAIVRPPGKTKAGLQVKLEAGLQVKIEAGLQVKLEAGLQVKLEAGLQVKLEAGLKVKLEAGLQVKLEAGLQVKLEAGLQVKLEAALQVKSGLDCEDLVSPRKIFRWPFLYRQAGLQSEVLAFSLLLAGLLWEMGWSSYIGRLFFGLRYTKLAFSQR